MIDFPVPTVVGQIFQSGGYTYRWDGTTWSQGPQSNVLPDAPTDGKQYARQSGAWSVVKASGARGGGTDQVFWENDQIVTLDYTLTAGKNAVSAGPITVAANTVVTVPSGQNWTIV